MGLELNLMAFIPLLIRISSVEEVERGVKYFLVQALGSGLFLWGGFWLYSLGTRFDVFSLNWFCSLIFLAGLLLKIGSFPFHFWVISVISSLSWLGCILLATWQKVAPLFLFFWFFFDSWFYIVMIIAVLCSLVGGLGGVNQVQLRVLIAYSSINHLGWILAVAAISFFGLAFYYIVYFIISFFIFFLFFLVNYDRVGQVFFLVENKLIVIIILLSLISLAGLPPFTGFIRKWVVFQEIIIVNQTLYIIILILGSIFRLYFYLNLFFSVFLIGFRNSFNEGKSVFFRKLLLFFLVIGLICVVFGLGWFEIFYGFVL